MTTVPPRLGVSLVIVAQNDELHDAIIKIIRATTGGNDDGLVPVAKSGGKDEIPRRAHYNLTTSTLMITGVRPVEEMREPFVCYPSIVVNNPVAAGIQAKDILEGMGYETTLETKPVPDFPDEFIVHVKVRNYKTPAMAFVRDRTTTPTELLAQLPKREPWSGDGH